MKRFVFSVIVLSWSVFGYVGKLYAQDAYQVSFSTHVRGGTQADQLRVKVSTDFNGKYNKKSIQKATWHDITDQFTFTDSSEYKPAGTANIGDLVVEGKPLFIAFQYINNQNSVHGRWRVWRVNSFSLTVNGTEVVGRSNANWTPVKIGDWQEDRGVAIGKASIAFNGNVKHDNESDKEAWAISKPLILKAK